jgi:hypothetical protein
LGWLGEGQNRRCFDLDVNLRNVGSIGSEIVLNLEIDCGSSAKNP